jgi:hypothetical protein
MTAPTTDDPQRSVLDGHDVPPFSPADAPDRSLTQQARAGVARLPAWMFDGMDDRERLVAALVFEAKLGGLGRIDDVKPSASGTGVFAIQGQHGDDDHRSVYVDRGEALARSAEEHRERLREEEAVQRRAAERAAMARPDEPAGPIQRLRSLLP